MNSTGLVAFLTYFGTSLGLLLVGAALVALITPHRDVSLIRAGNTAAAIAFAGTLIGLALPLHAAVSHSADLIDACVWGAIATGAQVLAYLLAHLAVPSLTRQITDNIVSSGIFAAGISISIGLLNAAAMTP